MFFICLCPVYRRRFDRSGKVAGGRSQRYANDNVAGIVFLRLVIKNASLGEALYVFSKTIINKILIGLIIDLKR